MSAMVRARNGRGEYIQGRALLDTCATANFITEEFAKKLQLPMDRCPLSIDTIGAMSTSSKYAVEVSFKSIHSEYMKTLTFLTVPTIASLIPSEVFPRHSVSISRRLRLADPDFHLPRPVDLLVGAGATLSLFSIGQIDLSQGENDLIVQKTQLGWVIAGGTSNLRVAKPVSCNLTDLSAQIARFWKIEELESQGPTIQEEEASETHYLKTVERDKTGRYIVRLPFKDSDRDFGDSYSIAKRRLHALDRRFEKDEAFKGEYSRVMQEYLDLGHMSEAIDMQAPGYYLPHHAVIKSDSITTRLRVVFDASAKSRSGRSLNDALLVGPTIQDKIFEHLLRFRLHKYVLTADIEKMYRQILVNKEDRKYQRVLWRVEGAIKTFELNTVTFGVSAAPFLAIRTIKQLTDDEKANFPKAAAILRRDLYVDDLLTGAATSNEILEIQTQVTEMLKRGGFHIRKWASNCDDALVRVAGQGDCECLIDKNSVHKTLGISWNTKTDRILYNASSVQLPEKVTKRMILSTIARIYDPLGLLGPIILCAKIIMQTTWKCQITWDESVPASLYTRWSTFAQQLGLLDGLSVDRLLIIDNAEEIQIHGFSDASQVGYGACLYIRSQNQRQETSCKLLCAKSRVAPLRALTIPRAELCGALLLAKLYEEVMPIIGHLAHSVFFWCDSLIVLHWLRTPVERLKVFVANRVAQIQQITNVQRWHHVGSRDNPADALSRGQLPRVFLENHSWFTGPSFLREQAISWPCQLADIEVELPDIRKAACLTAKVGESTFLNKFSSYSKLVRVAAYCLRVRTHRTGPISCDERGTAEIRILKLIQASQFEREISRIRKLGEAARTKFSSLCPFLDEAELLRVGGRLKNANIPFSSKHPILLPTHNHVTDLIIRETHLDNHHSGIQTTLSILRQRFWLCNGKNQVRKVIRTCMTCFRFNAKSMEYKMANLPSVRIQSARPFQNTGVDFCGPFLIKEKKYRNRQKIKTYVSVFICMVTRAVHLEVVSELTTEAFLATLRRFVARRGLPENIYSDNGTNFVGAHHELHDLYALLQTKPTKDGIHNFATHKNIQWHFSVPSSPHFGGLWEAAVKTFKHHLKRVIGGQLYTFEEFNTLVIEIEAILNSRPICSLSSDPNDPSALTPAHFLIGQPMNNLPEPDITSVPQNRLTSWRLITQARQHFWKRWYLEYLHELQQRQKWTTPEDNLKINTVVLIKDKGLPCSQWALGRVIEIHHGDDGVVRAATVKTTSSTLKRCVRQLCPLPNN